MQIWVLALLIIMCIEPFFFLIRICMNKRFDEQAHKAALDGDFHKIQELEEQDKARESGQRVNPIEVMGDTLMKQNTVDLSKSRKQ